MSQPPNSNPASWAPRTDAGARKLIEQLLQAKKDLLQQIEALREEMKRELGDRPKEARLYGIIGACAIAVLIFVMTLVNNGKADTKEVVKAQADAAAAAAEVKRVAFEEKVLGAIEHLKHTQQVELRAIYDAMAKRKRSPVLETPVPAPAGVSSPAEEP